MTLSLIVPDRGPVDLDHLLLDVNGTLTRDGRLLEGIAPAVRALADTVSVRLLTADTFGTARTVAQQLGVALEIVTAGEHKRALLEQLGPERCVAFGNGRNDVAMLRSAALGIAVIGPEGASAEALSAADVICVSILDALGLLTQPTRLTATLRP